MLNRKLPSLMKKIRRPTSKAPRPNTRFLKNIIRETDNHNAALRAKEAEEARARARKLRAGNRKETELEPQDGRRHKSHYDTKNEKPSKRRRVNSSDDDYALRAKEAEEARARARKLREGKRKETEPEVQGERKKRNHYDTKDDKPSKRRRINSSDDDDERRKRRHDESRSHRSEQHLDDKRSRHHRRPHSEDSQTIETDANRPPRHHKHHPRSQRHHRSARSSKRPTRPDEKRPTHRQTGTIA